MSLVEKFQTILPAKEEDGEAWATDASARERTSPGSKFNAMPPGMDISDQFFSQQPDMPLRLAGRSDVSADTNPASLADGYKKRVMRGDDDCYTGEHVDQFYGDAGGFAERNNYLDRI